MNLRRLLFCNRVIFERRRLLLGLRKKSKSKLIVIVVIQPVFIEQTVVLETEQ